MKTAKWMQGFLNRHFSIEPNENVLVQLFLVYFTLISAFYTVALAVSETLFVSQFNTDELKLLLPWIYISIALATICISWIYDRYLDSLSRIKAVLYSDALFIISILAMRFLLELPGISSWSYFLLVVLLEAFALFKIILFFSFMGDYFASHHAKRLYAYIINGMALGSFIGGFIVAILSYHIQVTNILFVCIILLGLSSVFAIKISSISVLKKSKTSSLNENPIKLNIIFKNNYIKLLFALTILIGIVGVVADYTMLLVASKELNESALANFFGKFFSYIGISQLILQLFLSAWLVKKLGLQRTLFILPICIIAACFSFFYSPILIFAALINYVYLMFTETLDLSSRQMLFLLLPTRVRVRSQSISDGIVASLGKIIAGFVVLGFALLDAHILFYAHVIFLVSLVWIGVLLIITLQYKKVLSQSILKPFLFSLGMITGIGKKHKKALTVDKVSSALISSLQNIDSEKQKLIISIIPREAFYTHKLNITKLFSNSSEPVIKELLLKLAKYGTTTDIPLIESLISDNRKSVRAAAIIAYTHIKKGRALPIIVEYFYDPIESVKIAAITSSYKYCHAKGRELAKNEIKKLLMTNPKTGCRIIGNVNIKYFHSDLNQLLFSNQYDIRKEAVLASQKCSNPLFIKNLVQLLPLEIKLRNSIVQALVKMPMTASPKFYAIYHDKTLSSDTKGIILQVMSRRGDEYALNSILEELSYHSYSMTILACYQAIKLFPDNFVIKSSHKKNINNLLNKLANEIMLQQKIYYQLGFLSEKKRIFFRDTIYFCQVIYFTLLGLLNGIREIEEIASLYSGRISNVTQDEIQDVLSTILPSETYKQANNLKLLPDEEIHFFDTDILYHDVQSFINLSLWHKCLIYFCKDDLTINNELIGAMNMKEEETQLINKMFIVSILKKAEIFKDIPVNELLIFADIAQEVVYYSGEVLFKEGDHGDSLYLIISGTVRIHSEERDIATLGTGECIGELSLLDNLPRSATATIVSEAHVLKLNADDFLNLIAIYPDISRRLLKILSIRLRNTTESWILKQ